MMVITVIFILISLGIFTYKIVKENQRVGIAVDQLVMIRSGMESLKIIDPNSDKTIAMLLESKTKKLP